MQPPSVTAAPTMRPGDSSAVGIVRSVGAMPLEQLVLQSGGRSLAITGPLKDEVAQLEGAEVRVWGRPVANQPPTPPRALDVSGYEVVAVGGATPVVGILMSRDETMYLVTGADTLQLAVVPGMLRTKEGAKVWLVGSRDGNAFRVGSYGIIRER